MKNLLRTLGLCLLSLLCAAQTEKGRYILSGGGSYYGSNMDRNYTNGPIESKASNLFVDVGGTYMFLDQIAANLAFLMQSGSNEYNGIKTSETTSIGLRLAGRYYHPCLAPRFYTFGELGFSYMSGTFQNYDFDTGERTDDGSYGTVSTLINPGFVYFLTPSIALEMSFGLFGWQQSEGDDSGNPGQRYKTEQIQFLLNSRALSLGFSWWLGRKGKSFS